MSEPDTDPSPLGIPAATVVVFRRAGNGGPPEILMVTRNRSMAFAGGAAVFPGGRVDPADFDLAGTEDHGLDLDEAAHRIAAIRETLEETGLVIGLGGGTINAERARAARAKLLECGTLAPVLSAFGWALELDRLLPFSRWFPKNERLPRVFDTRFYLADLGTGAVEVAVDETENTRLFWTSAQGALDAAARDELTVIFPTRRNLERLAQFGEFAEAAEDCARHPVQMITPFITKEDGAIWLRIAEGAGYPITAERIDSAKRS